MNNTDRPRCVGCGSALRHDEFERLACRRCEHNVKEDLDALAGPSGLFARLTWLGVDALSPTSRRSNGPVVKTSKTTAPPPVRLQSINLLGAGGVVHTLQRWVASWYGDLGFQQPVWRGQHHFVVVIDPNTGRKVHRPGQLDNTVKALMNNLPWAVENRRDFDTFSNDVHRFVSDSEQAIDPTIERPPRVRIGRCPSDVEGMMCGAILTADPYALSIRCGNCGTSWGRESWAALGDVLKTT